MNMSSDLFLAIVAMDAYNRGYNAGIGGESNGLGGTGSQIGHAQVVKQSDTSIGSTDREAGFYAIAYKITDGSQIVGLEAGDTVISCRKQTA
ncbi:hypothetical protein [Oricola sp.]|uniref:hypothetical protein n=1 Tax=Oricola sp. TaxID=1979950 RepID=UPI003BACD407